MRWIGSFLGVLVGVAVLAFFARLLGLDDFIRDSIIAGHLLDWVMGTLALLWLLVILKAPWDLYFQAHLVAFDQSRSRERGIVPQAGRENYLGVVRRRLLWLAVGLHIGSAGGMALLALLTGGKVGWWFAGFYLLSTLFRPLIAGYVYLSRRLTAIGEETRYPREDVQALIYRVAGLETQLEQHQQTISDLNEGWQRTVAQQERETADLREKLHSVTRTFETTVNRLTDNQEIISGIQGFLRLIRQTATD